MKDFEFIAPTRLIFGRGKEKEVGKTIKEYQFHKVLIHYGKQSVIKSGLLNTAANSLTSAGIEYIFLGGVEPNPKLSFVKEGIELVRKEKVDLILAIGGGSVIDSAKAIACGTYYDKDPFDFNKGLAKPQKALPVGVILTIAAAGSEMSTSCVISNDSTKEKRGFNSTLNRPLFSIMNPELTYTVSPYQTACGIVDIMMHTLERYFNPSEENDLADDLSLGLLRNVVEAGMVVMDNPRNYEARAQLMLASSLSHNGLTGLGKRNAMPVHQLEHIISGEYDEVAHGAGLAVLFPAWAWYNYKLCIDKFARFAQVVMKCDFKTTEENARMGIIRLQEYFQRLKMPTTFKDLGIINPNCEYLARRLTDDGKEKIVSLNKDIDMKDAQAIFESCLL